jgi:hypothetical protein
MTGGLINIVTYGTQDIYLTGTPQISYFKIVYRRYTNFSVESVELDFDNEVGFDVTSTKVLPLIGDLVHRVYMKIDLPEIAFERIVSQEEIKQANDIYYLALDNYKQFGTFMTINSNAFRAALDVYNASNIVYSSEMVQSIIAIFKSYSMDPLAQQVIAYFSTNSPIWYIQPIDFNLLLIANSIKDPATFPKESLKVLLDNAIKQCKTLVKYYETTLKAANTNRLDVVNRNFKFAWVDRIGHAIIEQAEVYIGGERIDRHYGEWINIWYELAGRHDLEEVYFKMIGNVPELTNFDRTKKPAYSLYVPLQFWFNRFSGLAIPIVALQYHEVSLSIKLRDFKSCAYVENMSLLSKTNPNYKESIDLDDLFESENLYLNASLYVDYVYLDTLERRRFAQSSHEYLIDQLQIYEITDVDQLNIQSRMDFFNPCKELVWVMQKQSYVENNDGFTKCRWNNYSASKFNKGLSTDFMSMDFNGYERIGRLNGMYFNYLQPYYCHSNTPSDGINVYSFALKPEEQQPTGQCNFSRITKTFLNLWINHKMFLYYDTDKTDEINTNVLGIPKVTKISIRWYTTSHNVLRIVSGIGGLAYT